jgi:hypothetical protein
VVAYQSQLNTGAGGFVIVSATPASLTLPVSVANGGTGDTSLTAYAVMCGGTTSTNPVQSIASVGTSGQVLTSNGAGALPTMQTPAAGGGITSVVTYTTTQTVTIPSGATKAWIRLVGGGANAGGAYLEKYLSSLTPGNTLALTIGAGAAWSANAGDSRLASGSQTITTLTAAGAHGPSPGVATNGDVNIGGGFRLFIGPCCVLNVGGISVLSTPNGGYGGGAAVGCSTGTSGVMIVLWSS